jgi:anti-sigma regulatory factor (Ser/Thr protein kinase)
MGELMVIPADFGVPACDRLDITVENMEEVMTISRAVQTFCREKGIDERRSVLAALALEEMAGNVAEHGFQKDRKKHTADIRVVYKNQGILLRISDDCVPFNPSERRALLDSASPEKNVGIRMVYEMAEDVQYQNILGLNVLTIRL